MADAHLPAYQKAGLIVKGVYDPDLDKAEKLVSQWDCVAYRTLEQALGQEDVVFNLATPPAAHVDILRQLPVGAPALIQNPWATI